MESERSSDLALRQRLGAAWNPFFLRYGTFTPIQRTAMPAILDGKNVVVTAATAGGKTEAALAPLAARKAASRDEGWTLVVSPTRALVNDLYRRLEQPLGAMGLHLGRRTGDHPSFDAGSPPRFLITTPESFDSLLTRIPRAFVSVTSMVIDELHLFDHGPRGDQLRILCRRLRLLHEAASARGDAVSESIQFVALSATLRNPLAVASRYFDDACVAGVAGSRQIEADVFDFSGPACVLPYLLSRQPTPRKVLVFTRSRREAEQLAAALDGQRPYSPNTFVHHGSLSKAEREEVENRFGSSNSGVCVATTTLEVGIDIGDVDLVVLVRPPHSVSSFLQQIGRGCRRSAGMTRVGCGASNVRDKVIFEALLRAATLGDVADSTAVFRPSVAVQQVAAYLKQRGEAVDRESFVRLFAMLRGEDKAVAERFFACEQELHEADFLSLDRGQICPGSKLHEIYEGGSLFTNFAADQGSFEIRDRHSEMLIGHADLRGGEQEIAFGGKKRRIVERQSGVVYVEGSLTERDPDLVQFRSRGPKMTRHLCRAIGNHFDIDDSCVVRFSSGRGDIAHGWFLGAFESEIMGQVLASRKIEGRPSPLWFRCAMRLDADALRVDESEVIAAARSAVNKLAGLLDPGAPTFRSFVPGDVETEWVVASARATRLWEWSQALRIQDVDAALENSLRVML